MPNDGKIFAISVSDVRGVKKHNVEDAEFVEEYGIRGDAHAGKWHRQVSLLAIESIEGFNDSTGYGINPGDFAENLTVEGVNLLEIPVGGKLEVGNGVILEITQHGKQCHHDCVIFQEVGKCAMPTEGIFARVLRGGSVKVGDPVKLEKRKKSV